MRIKISYMGKRVRVPIYGNLYFARHYDEIVESFYDAMGKIANAAGKVAQALRGEPTDDIKSELEAKPYDTSAITQYMESDRTWRDYVG